MTAAAAAGLLAGCASASTHQAGTAPAGGAASAKTATARAPAGAPAAGTGSAASGTAGLAPCKPSSLQVTVNASQAGGAAGSTYLPVDFTNTSGSPCGLYGYPGHVLRYRG